MHWLKTGDKVHWNFGDGWRESTLTVVWDEPHTVIFDPAPPLQASCGPPPAAPDVEPLAHAGYRFDLMGAVWLPTDNEAAHGGVGRLGMLVSAGGERCD